MPTEVAQITSHVWKCFTHSFMNKYTITHLADIYISKIVPVMAAIAVRKKVISIGHFSPCFRLQSLQIFLFVRLNQEQLYVLNALKIREK